MVALSRSRARLLVASLMSTLALGACSHLPSSAHEALSTVTPYRVEVVQGNVVSREQVDALKAGMSRQQVRELLGTSLLADIFHADRWDYVFTIDRLGVERQRSSLALFFVGGSLDHFVADRMPSEQEFASMLDPRKHSVRVPKLEASAEELEKFPRGGDTVESLASSARAPLPAIFPPLEPKP